MFSTRFSFVIFVPFFLTGLGQVNTAQADMILGTELSPAMCGLNPAYRNLRQCVEGQRSTINFFRVTDQSCQNQKYKLPPLQESVVARYIPDANVRQQVWQSYGRCSGMSSVNYFRKMATLSSGLRLPKVLTSGTSYRISNAGLIQQLTGSNPGMPASAINLYCQRNRANQTVVTYINTCYDNSGRYTQCRQYSTSCPSQFYIIGGR